MSFDSDFNQMSADQFDTDKLLKHARAQAKKKNYKDFIIVDVDSHHYENQSIQEILQYIEDPVVRQLVWSISRPGTRKGLSSAMGSQAGDQGISGRVTRNYFGSGEEPSTDEHRDIALTKKWMDALGTDIAILFPTPMLFLGLHPQIEFEVALARAYNRWLVETILAKEPRIRTLLYLPFNDPEASYQMVEEFGDKKGVIGFMVTSVRHRMVHDNAYMKTYAALQERGLPLGFHAAYNWNDRALGQTNKFLSAHALGFTFYNMIHLTNWVINGLPERFPKLKTIWIESGLAWVPFLMQRLDHEYMMRSSEAPGLKGLPSEYMREMYYSCQPMEQTNNKALEMTFDMINAKSQLLYSSDYPHWDFDPPSVIYDLPFLSYEDKKNILGGNAIKLFGLEGVDRKLAKI